MATWLLKSFNDLRQPGSALFKTCEPIGEEDRISELPEELLCHILSSLTLKEAIATSILSRRWKHVWMSSPSLDFGCVDAFKHMRRDRYAQLVSKVVGLYGGLKLDTFKVHYPLRDDSRCHIDYWLAFAIANGVSILELDFRNLVLAGGGAYYYFPADVFHRAKTMDSQHCNSLISTSLAVNKPFGSVTNLCLRSVHLSDEVFEIMLSSFLSLESFRLMDSYGLVYAKNKVPHLKLKSLEVYLCKELEKLELVAPNLLSFKYQGRKRNICIKHSSQLVNLRLSTGTAVDVHVKSSYPLGDDFVFCQFATLLSKLESLTLDVHLFEDMKALAKFPAFNNLKQLALDVQLRASLPITYHAAVAIMRAAPNLQQLELNRKVERSMNNGALELGPMPLHQNLKQVRLLGFVGDANSMEFVTYILERAVSLQKIDIFLGYAIKLGETYTVIDRTSNAYHARCKNCTQQLRQRLPSNVQLILHGDCFVAQY